MLIGLIEGNRTSKICKALLVNGRFPVERDAEMLTQPPIRELDRNI